MTGLQQKTFDLRKGIEEHILESFLLLAAFAEQDKNAVLNRLNVELANESANVATIEKKKFKERFMSGIPDTVSFVSSLLSIYSAGRPIVEAVLSKIS